MKKEAGFSLVEALVAIGIATVVLVSLLVAFQSFLRAALDLPTRVKASYLAEEGLEALRIIRDQSWASSLGTLTVGNTYYLAFTGVVWQTTTTPQYIDGRFLRSFTISSVARDGNDDITSSGGTIDLYTKKVTVSISWSTRSATTTLTLPTYFTRLVNN